MNRKGFTLIEVIVVAAIIAILAGILVPMIINQVDDSKVSKAKGDLKTMQTAIQMFKNDLSTFPIRHDGSVEASADTFFEVLKSAGNEPAVGSTDWGEALASTGGNAKLLDHLRINVAPDGYNYPATKWKGPYLGDAPGDPWGNAYYIGAKNFVDDPLNPGVSKPVWIISAGADGILQTNTTDEELVGDDIGIRYK
ncbi:MAG: type II secretion system protein GspG [Desulfuromonadaceae bacterium]|nr:type II secretion system protein GspG [Desulfuromonadaceae bacterium]